MRHITIGEALAFDAVLDVLIVGIELGYTAAGAIAAVVGGDDGFESSFFLVGRFFVVCFFLWQVFLKLFDIFVALGRWRENTGDI